MKNKKMIIIIEIISIILFLFLVLGKKKGFTPYQLGAWNAKLSGMDSLTFQKNFEILQLEGFNTSQCKLGAGFNNLDSIKVILQSGGKIHLNGEKLLKELKLRKINSYKPIKTSKIDTIFIQKGVSPKKRMKKVKKVYKGAAPKKAVSIKPLTRKEYVKRFKKVAKVEEKKYGIPYKITLAQAIIEGGAGTSTLSLRYRNHFGIKCHSKRCKKGHCTNFTDDSHKDFFRIYKNAWHSYRSHSKVLQKERYNWMKNDLTYSNYLKACKKNKRKIRINKRNWKKLSKAQKWAYGLDASGYATNTKYYKLLLGALKTIE